MTPRVLLTEPEWLDMRTWGRDNAIDLDTPTVGPPLIRDKILAEGGVGVTAENIDPDDPDDIARLATQAVYDGKPELVTFFGCKPIVWDQRGRELALAITEGIVQELREDECVAYVGMTANLEADK
jgi:hypothetical protein